MAWNSFSSLSVHQHNITKCKLSINILFTLFWSREFQVNIRITMHMSAVESPIAVFALSWGSRAVSSKGIREAGSRCQAITDPAASIALTLVWAFTVTPFRYSLIIFKRCQKIFFTSWATTATTRPAAWATSTATAIFLWKTYTRPVTPITGTATGWNYISVT